MTRPIIRVIDVETGADPILNYGEIIEPGIIEIGYQDLVSTNDDLLGNPTDWQLGQYGVALVDPGRAIAPETSAIHNIIDQDIKGAPTWEAIRQALFSTEAAEGVVAYAAHNITCESTLIPASVTNGKPWICTYKAAVRLWPDMASHSNASVRYHLNPRGLDRRRAEPTHRALPDAYVTAHTLLEALKEHPWGDLVDWSTRPVLLPRCKIGALRGPNGRGTPWAEVDSGMLRWIIDKRTDENELYTAAWHLEQREIDQRIAWENEQLRSQLAANGLADEGDANPDNQGTLFQ